MGIGKIFTTYLTKSYIQNIYRTLINQFFKKEEHTTQLKNTHKSHTGISQKKIPEQSMSIYLGAS